jgi:hypothetical protein
MINQAGLSGLDRQTIAAFLSQGAINEQKRRTQGIRWDHGHGTSRFGRIAQAGIRGGAGMEQDGF